MPPAPVPALDRRTAIVDAALHVIGTRGLGESTHRAVQDQAGVPHGSVTYYFASREGLLEAAVLRMMELDRARVAAMAQQLVAAFASSGGVDAVMDAVAEGAAAILEADPIPILARFELLLAGSRDPALGRLMLECTDIFRDLAKPVTLAAGSDDPDRDARIVMAMVDGLFLDQLAKGPPDPAVLRRGIRAALRSVGPRA